MEELSSNYGLYEQLARGGWLMLPLALCSVLAVAITIERFIWGPRQSRVLPRRISNRINDLLKRRRFDELLGLCRADESPLARIIITALENVHRPQLELKETLELAGKHEASKLEKNTGVLGTIAAISPLLGLLGTVFGMIKTFAVIQTRGVGNAEALAGGISEALITTAAGLTIAIPTLLVYRYFLHLTRKRVMELEQAAMAVVHSLNETTQADSQVRAYELSN